MERIADQRDCVHLFLGHLDSRGILTGVEFGQNPEPGRRPGVPDAVDDSLIRRQRGTAPVRRDVTEEPVLDLVPLAGAGWKMAHLDGQSGLVGQLLELMLPGAIPISVAPARIGRDETGLWHRGRRPQPIWCHQWRIDATANVGVSWSHPTLTQASLRAMS